MRWLCSIALAISLACSLTANAEDVSGKVRKAIEESTLDQPGTKPFHLKAILAPSFERDKDSGRTGEVEIWWASPKTWKREVRCPVFHQIEIVDGGHDWHKNEGEFFPEWLREGATELIDPIPSPEGVLENVKHAEGRNLFGRLSVDWIARSGTPETPNIQRSSISLDPKTGLIVFAFGFGWGAELKNYQRFHNRNVARTVSWDTPQVTAQISTLEDLGTVSARFFDTGAPAGDPQPMRTELIDEVTLRKNLLPMGPITWPALQDGVLQGNVTTNIVVDREGMVREVGSVISENNAINSAGREAAMSLRFRPFVVNGIPEQVVSQVTLPFKTTRPAGTETFASARTYFEDGRRASFPAWGASKPYVLHAEFEALVHGSPARGSYVDTWLGNNEWRREAWIADSRYARLRNGDKGYQLIKGDDTQILRLVFRIIEPIPAIDTFQESDWRIRRDSFDGLQTIRVLAGYESPDGKLDPEQSRGYWFDNSGVLVKAYFGGLEIRRSSFTDFQGTKVANQIDVLRDGKLAMRIHVTEISLLKETMDLLKDKGNEWQRSFTDEQR
jgi:hypothetical protein